MIILTEKYHCVKKKLSHVERKKNKTMFEKSELVNAIESFVILIKYQLKN